MLYGGQKLVHENIVNVPFTIAVTVNVLPRSMSSTDTVEIKVKKAYTFYEFKETIQPKVVWKAVHYLLHNIDLNKDAIV